MLSRFIARDASHRSLDAIARQVADACLPAVCRLVAQTVAAMGPCEARGYIRGRSSREIRRTVRAALSRLPGAHPTWEAAITARAADRLPPLVMRQLAAAARKGATQRAA